MKKWVRYTVRILSGIVLLLLCWAVYFVYWQLAPIAAGYKAKLMCSAVFVANRQEKTILAEELSPVNKFLSFVSTAVDYNEKTATATAFGLVKRTAVYRECLGCTILPDGWRKEDLKQQVSCKDVLPADPEKTSWPTGDLNAVGPIPPGVDAKKLEAAVASAFAESDPDRPKRTRGVVVVYKGRIIAERYAPGFTKDTPQHAWSMSKSLTNTLTGILVGEGKLDINAPAPVKEWQAPGDPRSAITLSHLLRMSGGFDFHTDMSLVGDRQKMLFGAVDVGASAVAPKLLYPPGTYWEYSNANPHTIWKVIHEKLGGGDEYFSFSRKALFNRIGMRSALIEPDPYGTFMGAAFAWATPRDWARLGLLYLNDGVWEGKRILPEGWVAYSITPAPADKMKHYGAFLWLNADNSAENIARKKLSLSEPPFSELPRDAYFFWGMWDQTVTIIPSCELVLVRMGLTHVDGAFKTGKFVGDIIAALGRNPAK